MTIRDIMVTYGFEIDKNSASKVENAINSMKNLASKALGVIGVGLSITGIGQLAEAAADAQAMKSQFSQVFGDVEANARDKLNKIAEDTGVSVNRMKNSFTEIAAFAKTTGMGAADALGLSDRAMSAVTDSAAFYDKSIEEVTDSLQSFLKGNYENDAALGLSATETTRNSAANALYKKSFNDLSESQKQLTLLKMVEDANKASGALGQASRESDTWTNQLGNLKQSLTDLKAAAGNGILKPGIVILKALNSLTKKAAVAISELTSENGFLTRSFEKAHAIVKRLQPAFDRMTQTLSNGVKRSIDFIKGVVDKLGGIENVLKVSTIAASIFFAVLSYLKLQKLIKTAGGLANVFGKLGKVFSLANLKILAVVAIIVVLALIVEDFINFLKGNDSVIGAIFDKSGIGADNARKAIFKAWGKIRDFLLQVWDFIKTAAGMYVDTVTGFFEKHMDSIKANFERAWGLIKTFLSGVWTFISQLAATLFGGTEENFDGSTKSTKDKLLSVWQSILDALSAIWDALYEAGSAVFNAVSTVIEFVFGAIKAFWNSWGSEVLALFKVLWDSVGGILNGFLEVVKGVANFISSVFTGDWQGAWDAIKQIFTGIWDIIVNYITAVWETIKLLFSMALSAISAIWNSVWNAIVGFFQGIWNGIVSFLSGVWASITGIISGAINGAYNVITSVLSAIQSFFGNIFSGIATLVSSTFSNILSGITSIVGNIKDAIINGLTTAIDWIKALPSQALQWGADIIGGIVDGIKGAIGKVTDAVSGVADKIKSFLHFSVPDEGPLTDYQSWMPDFMGGLAKGIGDNESTVLDKVKGLVSGIATLTQAATAKASTATTSTANNSSSSVKQNVNINNSYNGGSTETQKNVSKAMKKSATDATTYMARGLAYARG